MFFSKNSLLAASKRKEHTAACVLFCCLALNKCNITGFNYASFAPVSGRVNVDVGLDFSHYLGSKEGFMASVISKLLVEHEVT